MRTVMLALALVAMPVSDVVLQPRHPTQGLKERRENPGDPLLLMQSELDYLEVASRELSLDLDRVAASQALKRIAAIAGLSIEVEGTFPKQVRLTCSFQHATVKDVLIWYASEVPVTYKAKGPTTLLVVVDDEVDEAS